MSTEETVWVHHDFKFDIPKTAYIIKFTGSSTACLCVNEPAKYPNAWYRFWLRFFLGWTIEREV